MESLRLGRDVFIPFLEQNTELTPEDEKLLSEIMVTESDWYRKAKEPEQPSAADEMIAYAEKVASEYESEPQEERFEILMTSDAFPDPEDVYAIWDNIREKYYADDYGKILTYPTEEAANAGLAAVKKAVADKEAEEWLYVERAKQGLDPVPTQDNADLIGKEITIDNRKYVVESVGRISGDVSLRDITFQNSTGFPINRVEKIGYIQSLLEQAKAELPTEEKTEAPAVLSADRHNFRITDDTLGVGGAKEKFRSNMAAINLLHELEIENRLATPEEQEILSRYVGWGGLSMAFDEHNAAWADEFKELYATLSPKEYNAAMESTLTAFYTPPVVIKAMYEALDRLGFSQGNILEPSCGTGNFFGLLPESMAGSKLHGIELDPLTGKIAKQLYQKANIAIEGFEQTKLPDDHFDVVIGNVPFGEIRVNDSRYNAQKFLIHDYFFAKALDKVRAGGVVMFITSKGTMDKASPEVRKYIAQRAELLGAIRLPDNTFRANAGTEVTSDILILQKRDRVIDVEPDWVYLDTDENGITMNSYFVQHPEMVLGQMRLESTRFGKSEPACKAYEDKSLSELLHSAVQRINGEITELDNEIDQISDEQDTSIPADPNVRNFSFALVDGKVYFRENDRMTPATVSMTAENRIKGLIEIRDCVRRLIEYQTEDYPEEKIHTEQENQNNNFSAVVPYDLEQQRKESKEFLDDLTTRDQRMMFAVLTMVHTADSKEQLDSDTEALLTTARKHLCQFAVLKYQQMDGLNTVLPFGVRKIDALRTLTTESLAVFIPFRVQEIYHENGVYYGQNVISKNMIIANRRHLLNGNSFILGVSGAGKSFTAKEEMTNIILTDPNADIIIIDPEREYSPLVKAMQGEVIHISATSENHINAMDMNSDYGDGANPVILKSEFILSLCEQLIGGSSLGAKQKSIIDRCTASVYRYYQQGNYMGTSPTLQDFREELLKQDEPEAQEIALAIELFTDGSLNTFAKHTNVDTHSRLICYDIFDLGKQLQPIGMLVVLDSILNRITQNRAKGRNTFIFIDEIYLLFQHEYSANFLFTLWKRVRKYGAYCTGITQNVDDLLQSHTARTMLANSEFIIMLNQASTDRIELAKLLNISDLQLSYITNVGAGQGLLKVGSSLVPFVNKFPRNTELYKLMTTKFGEV